MWGEDWGTMVWGGAVVAQIVPALGVGGVIAGALALIAIGWRLAGTRRDRTAPSDPSTD